MRIWAVCATLLLLIPRQARAEVPAAPQPARDEARLLRFPTIHGDRIVFTYAGDLYTVPAEAASPAG